MSNFTVSARKYRPGTFETVVGQQHVTQTLKNAILSDRLGHAFLFCGPRGVGKTTCARILAKALNCNNIGTDGEPCGTCDACNTFQKQQSFNIYELDAASNNSVEDIRSLTEQVRFAPQSGKYKIYIIDEVHMLSASAFNAFLKTLEEPPSYAIFILATTERHKILPTILSRCQVFDFHRISIPGIIDHLKAICAKEEVTAEEEALYVIAQKADGALRDALSILDRIIGFSGKNITYNDVIENLNVLDYDYYFKLTDLAMQQDMPGTMLLFDEILRKGFDAHNFLNGLSEHLRNLLVCKNASTIKLLELSEGAQERYIAQSQAISMSYLLSALNLVNTADVNYKSSKNQRLHVELALMKLCHLNSAIKLSQNGETLISEKKKPEPVKATPPPEAVKAEAPVPASPSVSHQQPAREQPIKATPAFVKPSNGNGFSLNLNKIKEGAKDLLQKNAAPEVKEEQVFVAVKQELFGKAWQQYIDSIAQRGKTNLHAMAGNLEVNYTNDGEVEVIAENDSLRNQLEQDRGTLSDIMRENNSAGVKVIFRMRELSEEENKRPQLTVDKEKFRMMAEENPALYDLQQKLGLRID